MNDAVALASTSWTVAPQRCFWFACCPHRWGVFVAVPAVAGAFYPSSWAPRVKVSEFPQGDQDLVTYLSYAGYG